LKWNRYLNRLSEYKLDYYLWLSILTKLLQTVRILFIAILVFFLTNLKSQSFHGGIMAGLVGSQVAGDTYSGFNKAGLFLGGFVNWDFTKRSALQLELEYFQKGSRENPTEDNDYDSYIFRANYVELPVLYHFKINWFTLFAGPSAGVLFGYYEERLGIVISDENDYDKPARITLQMNAGFRFIIKEKFGFDFRYNFSLLNIRSKNVTGDVWRLWGYGQFHDAMVLSVFYQFR